MTCLPMDRDQRWHVPIPGGSFKEPVNVWLPTLAPSLWMTFIMSFNYWPHIHLGSLVQRRNGANTRWSTGYVAWVENHTLWCFFFLFDYATGHARCYSPGQESHQLQWKHGDLTTGLPKKSPTSQAFAITGLFITAALHDPSCPLETDIRRRHDWDTFGRDLGWKGQLSWGLSGLIFQPVFKHSAALYFFFLIFIYFFFSAAL